MQSTTQNTTTLAIERDLHAQVTAKAKKLRMTSLEMTNLLIAFALQNSVIEKPSPIAILKKPVSP